MRFRRLYGYKLDIRVSIAVRVITALAFGYVALGAKEGLIIAFLIVGALIEVGSIIDVLIINFYEDVIEGKKQLPYHSIIEG